MRTRFTAICVLTALAATVLAAQPTVTSLSPARNTNDAATTTNFDAGFSANMATPGSNDIRAWSNLRGKLAGAISGGGTGTLTFNPNQDLLPGEQVSITLTDALQQQGGPNLAAPELWQLRAKAGQGPGVFDRVHNATAMTSGWDVEFGDLDGDGDLDMVGVTNGQNYIYLNDGNGGFSSTALGSPDGSYACALADFDDDGDLDIVTAASPIATSTGTLPGQNLLYLNDGSAGFSSTVNLGPSNSYSIDVTTGDIDGDGDIDIVFGNGSVSAAPNDIFVNDGSANFTRRGVLISTGSTGEFSDNTWCVHLADADNDGDLDLFTGNFDFGPTQSYLFLNDGAGNYALFTGSTPTGIALGATQIVVGMSVADFNGDGWVDVAFGDLGQPAMSTYDRISIYWNNGSGAFPTSTVLSAADIPYALEAGDIDGDGDLDLAVGFENTAGYVLHNNAGTFSTTSPLASASAHNLAFADIDGDGDLDCASPDHVFFNGTNPPGINVQVSGNWLNDGDTVNVNYNDSVASLNVWITISDADSDPVSLATQITNSTTQGFNIGEWSAGSGAVPYSLAPQYGAFNQAGVTHDVTLTATDNGNEVTTFTFHVAVGTSSNAAPGIVVTSNSATVVNGGTLNVNWGTSLSALGLQIAVSDADSDPVALTGTVSNGGGTGILNSEFSNSGATPYTLTPGTGTFNQGGVTHVVSLSADDGNGGASNFSFNIVTGPAPAPAIEVYETVAGGVQINPGSAASGNRNFGSQLIAAGQTAALTVVIHNAGNADLSVTSVTLAGNNPSEFVLNTGGISGPITPGNDGSFTVAFDPSTVGNKIAAVTINHNDGSVANPFTFEVSGVGTAPAPAPIIVVSENGNTVANGAAANGGRAFGNLLLNSASAPLTITVSNAGNADLVIGAPVLGGADAGEFSVSGTGATVPAGQSVTFTVTYLAANVGTHAATVSFTHNDTSTGTPFSFGVSGTTSAAVQAGSTGGGVGGSGGGCVAGSSVSLIGLLFLLLVGGLAIVRNRRITD